MSLVLGWDAHSTSLRRASNQTNNCCHVLLNFFFQFFQGEDRIYLNVRSSHRQSSHSSAGGDTSRKSSWKNSQHRLLFGENLQNQNETVSLASSGSKQWTTITIPHNYIGSSWPIRVSIHSKFTFWGSLLD